MDAPDEELRLETVLPPPDSTLLLNQSIVLRFDRALDPLSVTRDSIRLVDERARTIPLERVRVREASIELLPRAPIHANLDDGSYRPGSTLRLDIAAYPRPDCLRSERGELLSQVPQLRYRVVDGLQNAAEGRLSFLPSSGDGPFRLIEAPRVDADGRRIELRFDRPVYPPSAQPSALRLVEDLNLMSAVPLSVEVGGSGAMRGRVLSLTLASPMLAKGAHLFFRSGPHGLLDYRLSPVEIPADPLGYFMPHLGRSLAVRPAPSSASEARGIEERFADARPLAAATLLEDLALPFEVEGALRWGEGGLFFPSLGWEEQNSLGALDPPATTRELRVGKPAEIATGVERDLPADTWDFDSVDIASGRRVFIVLPQHGVLRVRVAGHCNIAGELIFLVQAPGLRPARSAASLDATALWQSVEGRVEVEVAGLVRLGGRVRVEPEGVGLAGLLTVRDARGLGIERLALQVVERGDVANPSVGARPLLPGRWCAMSPWYVLPGPRTFAGISEAGDAECVFDVFVQGRSALPGAELSPWLHIEGLSGIGDIEALRFVVAARGSGDGARVLSSLRIR